MTSLINALRSTRNWLALGTCLLATAASPLAKSEVRYYHTDVLGSVAAISDEAGNIVERREFDPHGAQLAPSLGDGPNFTGHVADSATGLVQMQDRYFDPVTRRFLSVDAITANSGSLNHFNRYAYANNNPTTDVDLDGLQGRHFAGQQLGGGLESVVEAWQAYGAYKNGTMSAALTAQHLRDMGAPGKGYLEELRQVIRADAKGLERERRNGVARAWADERRFVEERGRGTRAWTPSQLAELKRTGRVSGFEGHHINSILDSPELAGVGKNVEFLTRSEHLSQHNGNWRNATSGPMIDRSTGFMSRVKQFFRDVPRGSKKGR